MTALSAAQLAKRWNCHRSSIYRGIRGGNIRTLDGFTPKRIPLSYVEAKEEEWRGESATRYIPRALVRGGINRKGYPKSHA